MYILTCLEQHVIEMVFPGQPMWKYLGNRFVVTHIRVKAQAKETEIVERDISFAVLTKLLEFRSSREPHFELQRDLVKEVERDLVDSGGFRVQEFQLKKRSRDKKIDRG
jgi:hypothetical protein